jgi:drug/metabolite transporter (DMT)-like permease
MNSIAGGVLLFVLLRRGTGAATSGPFYLVLPVTAVLAVPMLGQPLAPQTLVGLVITLAGVVLVARSPRTVPPVSRSRATAAAARPASG